MVAEIGIEPTTTRVWDEDSTTELLRHHHSFF